MCSGREGGLQTVVWPHGADLYPGALIWRLRSERSVPDKLGLATDAS